MVFTRVRSAGRRQRRRLAALLVVVATCGLVGLPAAAAAAGDTVEYTARVLALNATAEPAETAFRTIADVAADSRGNVYVADPGAHKVFRITPDGSTRTVFAGTGATRPGVATGPAVSVNLDQPYGLAVGTDDTVYVADLAHHRVVAVGQDGQLRVVAGNGATGAPVSGDALASPMDPVEVALGPDGTLYVADQRNNVVAQVRDGRLDVLADQQDGLFSPIGLAVRADGTLLISNKSAHKVLALREGRLAPYAGHGLGDVVEGPAAESGLSYPERIALDEQGNLYIADAGHDTIDVVDADGSLRALRVTLDDKGFDEPTGVAVFDGTVLIADQRNTRVVRWAPDARPTIDGPTTLSTSVGGSTAHVLTGSHTNSWSLVGPVPTGAVLDGASLSWAPARAGSSTVTVQACAWLARACTRSTVTLDASPLLPGAPRDAAGTVLDGGATLTWNPPADDGGTTLDGYTVTVRDETTGTRATATTTGTTLDLTGLVAGHRYTVTIAARNSAGPGPASSAVSLVLPPPPAVVVVTPTAEPTAAPTAETPAPPPTAEPTTEPTAAPTTATPAPQPTAEPTTEPTAAPTTAPTTAPTSQPTSVPVPVLTTPATPAPSRVPAAPLATAATAKPPAPPVRGPAPALPPPSASSTPTSTPRNTPGNTPTGPPARTATQTPSTTPAAALPTGTTPPTPEPSAPRPPTAEPATPGVVERLTPTAVAAARAVRTVGIALVRNPQYPSTVVLVAVLFLALQHRIDRDDPKLALAPVVPDEHLPFRARTTEGVTR